MEVNKSELPKNSEHWASIDGYSDYEVSWWGRVRNTATARMLKTTTNAGDYQVINLTKNGKRELHYVHKLVAHEWVLNQSNKQWVDQIDNQRSNNHWENLRFVSCSENSMNRTKRGNTSSIYKGVCFEKRRNLWMARINVNSKSVFLGYFTSEREAANAYNASAIKFYKQFAKLNVFED